MNGKRSMPSHSGLRVVVIALALCAGARADVVTTTFEGPVATIYMPAGHPFTLGDIMELSITYDSASPDVYSLPDPDRSVYRGVSSVSLSVRSSSDALLYSASSTGADARFLIHDEDPLDELGVITYFDTLSFLDESPATGGSGTLTGPDIMGMPLWLLTLSGVDEHDGGGPLRSDTLPTSFTPADWDVFLMAFTWHADAGPNRYIQATELTATTTVIPLPGALLLGVIGLGVAGWWHRRIGP